MASQGSRTLPSCHPKTKNNNNNNAREGGWKFVTVLCVVVGQLFWLLGRRGACRLPLLHCQSSTKQNTQANGDHSRRKQADRRSTTDVPAVRRDATEGSQITTGRYPQGIGVVVHARGTSSTSKIVVADGRPRHVPVRTHVRACNDM